MIEAIELTSTRRSRGAGGQGGQKGRGGQGGQGGQGHGGGVEKVSFDVYPGQVTALLGAPGTGKSTVLRLMVELEPGAGRTLFGGRPYRALRPAAREVGLALNPDAVHPGRTVQAHLALYSAAGGVPKPRIAEVLEVAGLSTQATVRCGRLDPGQRQRLAIAAALIGDPAALILDEPHALDTHGMTWFHALIRAYAAQGRTVLVAATDPDTLAGTVDHVVVLRRDDQDGISRVIASRSAAEVFDERRATVVQVRSPQAARLAAALEAEGARLAPAGPAALQVRGLDRARIGEVAHIAGVCLHELCEIGHDDDVFGLRPLPRPKELLAAPNPATTAWRSGVRLVADEIEEAEVVEAATQASAEAAAAPPMAPTPSVSAQASQNPTAAAHPVPPHEPEAATTAKPSVIGSWRTQGSVAGSRWSAVKGAQPPQGPDERQPRGAQESVVPESAVGAEQQGAPVAADSPAAGTARMTFVAAPAAADSAAAAPVAAAAASGAGVPAATDNAAAPPAAATFPPASATQDTTFGAAVPAAAADSASAVASSGAGVPAPAAYATGMPVATNSAAAPPAAVPVSAAAPASAATPPAAAPFPLAGPASSPAQPLSAAAPASAAAPPAAVPVSAAAPASAATPPAAAPLSAAAPASAAAPPAAADAAASASTEAPPRATAEASAPLPPGSAAQVATYSAPAPVHLPLAPAAGLAPPATRGRSREHRRGSAFGLRWGRSRPQPAEAAPAEPAMVTLVASAPAAAPVVIEVQPAVPFTVASAASGQSGAGGDGMTPWRAAVRAPQHGQQQVSVAEAAPAEQDASA